VPQRAGQASGPTAEASVQEPEWLPAQTHPPKPRRPIADDADLEPEPSPRLASTIVSYIVLAASLVVILLGIAVMIGMSRG